MKTLDELLKFDPLARAEEITGISIHDKERGNLSVGLGLIIAQENAAEKNAYLDELGDTKLCNELPRYLTIIEKYGFEQVLADGWISQRGGKETYFIFAHHKGLLLAFDTFGGTRVNGGKVYYNWRPHVPTNEAWQCTSSGSYYGTDDDLVWSGDHDCREALIHNLNKLNNRGEFVCPWGKAPFLWLLHYDETKVPGYDYKAISAARIERLPQWVRNFISGKSKRQTEEAQADTATAEQRRPA